MTFFPVDRDLLTSSIWAQGTPEAIKIWLYLLLAADQTGAVNDTDPAIALRCGLSLEATTAVLDWLGAPDPHSRTKDHDGRRIARLPGGGIKILNYARHQNKDYSTPRWRRWKERQRANPPTPPTPLANAATPLATKNKNKNKNKNTNNEQRTTDSGLAAGDSPNADVQVKDGDGALKENALVQAVPWNKEAADLWIARYTGKPTAAYFTHLKPLVRQYGWQHARQVLRVYLAETPEVRYLDVHKVLGGSFEQFEARVKSGQPPPGSVRRAGRTEQERHAGLVVFIKGGSR